MYPAHHIKSIRHAAATVDSAALAVVLRHWGLALREQPHHLGSHVNRVGSQDGAIP
jgi:hypothetical protein